VSAVRNAAVSMARGEFVAFVDDDEEVPETWLATLHNALAGSDASAAIGPVEWEFGKGIPDSIRGCRLFAASHYLEGEALPWYLTHTANSYVRVSALPDRLAPFNMHFGNTGGEDIAFFKRIADAGGTFLAAGRGSSTWEYRDRSRANFWWAVLRNGGNLADLEWGAIPERERMQRARTALHTATRVAIGAIKDGSVDTIHFVDNCIIAAELAGRALAVLGWRYREYAGRR
jgi:glycosyltransferase involved in cell wall biosynthesis